MSTESVQLGVVAVDSAHIVIADPTTLEKITRQSWDLLKAGDSQIEVNEIPLAVLTSTGRGDGFYPVTAEISDGTVHSVTVAFIEEETEGESESG